GRAAVLRPRVGAAAAVGRGDVRVARQVAEVALGEVSLPRRGEVGQQLLDGGERLVDVAVDDRDAFAADPDHPRTAAGSHARVRAADVRTRNCERITRSAASCSAGVLEAIASSTTAT